MNTASLRRLLRFHGLIGLIGAVVVIFGYSHACAQVPPRMISAPTNQIVLAGTNVTFSVDVFSIQPPRFQWRKNLANLPGETNATLLLKNVQVSAGGEYSVQVANSAGTITTNASLTVI